MIYDEIVYMTYYQMYTQNLQKQNIEGDEIEYERFIKYLESYAKTHGENKIYQDFLIFITNCHVMEEKHRKIRKRIKKR